MQTQLTRQSVTVDLTITIGGVDVAMWRVRVVGFVARLLGVPVEVE